jgi:PAS domain-containing protein
VGPSGSGKSLFARHFIAAGADAEERGIIAVFSPLRDATGGVCGLVVGVKDTTDQTLMRRGATELRTINERLVVSSVREQELAEAEADQRTELNALLERLSEGVVIAHVSGVVRTLNGAARPYWASARTRWTASRRDRPPMQDAAGGPLRSAERPLRRALSGEEFTDYEVLCLPVRGEPRRVVSTGTSVRDASGDVALAIVVFRDRLDVLGKGSQLRLILPAHDESE